MQKTKIIFLLLAVSFMLSACQTNPDTSAATGNEMPATTGSKVKLVDSGYQTSGIDQIADKLEVYYFHRTQRCVSCLAMGKYVKEAMGEYFSEQMANGQIDYKEINIDLAENKELARKFQASGSSLYINSIQGEQERIENIMEIWNLKSDEGMFKKFIKQKVDTSLGI